MNVVAGTNPSLALALTPTTGTLTGVVTNGAGGPPLDGASVQVQGTTGAAITGDGGQFSFLNVPLGPLTLVVSMTGYQTTHVPVTVVAGVNPPLTIALTATPSVCAPPPSGLASWWSGEGNTNDVHGSNHGTPQGGLSYGAGKVGQAFVLNGTDGYFDTPSNGIPAGNAARTVEMWLKPRADSVALDQNTAFFYGAVALRRGFGIDMDGLTGSGNVRLQVFIFFTDINGIDTGVKPDTYFHVAATYDGTTLRAFINGVEKGSFTPGLPLETATTNLNIGRSFSAAYFGGQLDEVSIYNRALQSSELTSIAGAGSAGKCR